MNNNTDSFCKHNHPSDNLKLKSILSIFTIGIFIFLGFASIEEGYPETEPVDCEFIHPVVVTQKCTVRIFDELGPLENHTMIAHISEYDKVNDNGLCGLVLKKTYPRSLVFINSNTASLILTKSYVSNDDEIEIYIQPEWPGHTGVDQLLRLKKSETDITLDIHLVSLSP